MCIESEVKRAERFDKCLMSTGWDFDSAILIVRSPTSGIWSKRKWNCSLSCRERHSRRLCHMLSAWSRFVTACHLESGQLLIKDDEGQSDPRPGPKQRKPLLWVVDTFQPLTSNHLDAVAYLIGKTMCNNWFFSDAVWFGLLSPLLDCCLAESMWS